MSCQLHVRALQVLFLLTALVAPILPAQNVAVPTEQAVDTPRPEKVYTSSDPGVTAPKALSTPNPEFTEDARKERVCGSVFMFAVVGTDGRARSIEVLGKLGHGLDEEAKHIVADKWRFKPAEKDGQPVAFKVFIEHSFTVSACTPSVLIASNTSPPYPESARPSEIAGTVWLLATVGKDGKPRKIETVKSLRPDLDAAAKRIVAKQWRYKPSRQDGHNIESVQVIAIHFDPKK